MAKLFANCGDPDQTLCSAVSGLGLHCLPITLLGICRLQWVKIMMLLGMLIICMHKLQCLFLFPAFRGGGWILMTLTSFSSSALVGNISLVF